MKSGEVVAGKYRLDARLGIGGMGEVWRASHASTGREFALKFMHAQYAASATSRQRFTREARVSAKINHPNVIDILDVGEVEDGSLFLAMELLEGVSLADALHAEQPLNVQEFLTVMLDTTRALAAAHAVGVVHRDIKPGNIFLHRDRATGFASAKILDFGISKLDEGNHTKTGAVLGSPRYMSPEQTRSAANVDARTDLWAMGVIFFEGLTGTWPHQGDSFSSLVVSICTQPPASIDLIVPELPEPLRAIVRDCLKPVDQRLQSAIELEARLVAIIGDPFLAHLTLPRPRHAPGDSVKSVSGVRIRPPLLTTTADRLASSGGGAESRRMSQPRPEELAALRAQPVQQAAAQPVQQASPMSSRSQAKQAAPAPSELMFEDDGQEPTQVRPLAPLDLKSMLAAREPAKAPAAQAQAQPVPPVEAAVPVAGTPAPAGGPVFIPRAKTVPMNQGAALQAELMRAGLLPIPGADGAGPAPMAGGDAPSAAAPQPVAQPAAAPQPVVQPAAAPQPVVQPAAAMQPVAQPAAAPQPVVQPAAAPQPVVQPAAAMQPVAQPAAAMQVAAPGKPDPLVATVSQLNFETRASTAPESVAPGPGASAAASGTAPTVPAIAQRRTGKALGVAAAVLSLLLVGIVVALVSVIRTPPAPVSAGPRTATAEPPPAPTAAPVETATAAPTASATASAEPAPAASATASVEPTASASASASASAAASAAPAAASASAKASASPAPAPKGPSKGPAPKGPSRVQQLGSGL